MPYEHMEGDDIGIHYDNLGKFAKTASGAKELYDIWASTYDQVLQSWGYLAPRSVAHTLSRLRMQRRPHHPEDDHQGPWAVVDLGCGTGLCGEAVKAGQSTYSGELRLIGMDISELSLRELRENRPGLYSQTIKANLEQRWPEEVCEGQMDAVVSAGVFTYIENFEALYTEVIRSLRPGGLFVFSHDRNRWDTDVRRCRSLAMKLVAKGVWACVHVGDPEAYMPANPDPNEHRKQIRIVAFRRKAFAER